jgi:hypothetical protein
MRQGVNYKLITLAVGIAVAIAIVFTLWIESPRSEISNSHAVSMAPSARLAKVIIHTSSRFMKNTVNIVSERYFETN